MNIIVVFLRGVCLIELHGESVVCLCMKQSCQLYFSPLYLDKSVNYHPQREALCYVLTSSEGLLSSSFVSYFIWSVAGHWHYVRTDSTTIPTRFYSRSDLKLNAVRVSVVCHHVSLLDQLNFSCVQFPFGCSVGCYSSFELASSSPSCGGLLQDSWFLFPNQASFSWHCMTQWFTWSALWLCVIGAGHPLCQLASRREAVHVQSLGRQPDAVEPQKHHQAIPGHLPSRWDTHTLS